MPSQEADIARRHVYARPLAKLTTAELDVLDQLSDHAQLFSEHIDNHLVVLGNLASRELGER